jgi:hypothetical protein
MSDAAQKSDEQRSDLFKETCPGFALEKELEMRITAGTMTREDALQAFDIFKEVMRKEMDEFANQTQRVDLHVKVR